MNFRPAVPRLFTLLRTYDKKQFYADLNAGIIVAVVALPLSIAFAIASGVSPEKGLITSVVAGFIVSLLGGSKVQIGGPTGAFVMILLTIVSEYGIQGLVVASIMAGLIQITMGLLHFGAIFKFIPYPIVIGFNSGIALSIFTSQIPDALGLTLSQTPTNFFAKWGLYFQNITQVSPWAIATTVFTILFIIYMPRILKKIPAMLLAILIVSTVAYILRAHFGITQITTIGDKYEISTKIALHTLSPFSYDGIVALVPAAFTIAIMGAIVTILSANISDGAISDHHNTNSELIAQGVANIVAPLCGGIPSTGAIARTMTNINSGGRTPVAGIVHALVVLLIMLFLGNFTRHIPLACLAGMLVVVSYNMSDLHTIKHLMHNPKSDIAVLLTTFFLTVAINLTLAIEVGLLLSIILFMRRISETSNVSVLRDEIDPTDDTDFVLLPEEKISLAKGIEVYEIEGPFFFGIANKFDEQMRVIGGRPLVRIIRMRKVPFIDSTGLHNFEIFIRSSHKENIHIILSGVNENVYKTLENNGIDQMIGKDNIHENINAAVENANQWVATHRITKEKVHNASKVNKNQ